MTAALDEIIAKCSGTGTSGPALFDYWQTQNCPLAYERKLNTAPDGTLTYTLEAALAVRKDIFSLFTVYQRSNAITNDIQSPEYNSFQETLLQLCLDPSLPGVCRDALYDDVCDGLTQENVLGNRTLTNFCGCYIAATGPATSYVWGTPGCFSGSGACNSCKPGSAQCAIINACLPLCHRSLSVQRANLSNGFIEQCPQNICVISDVVVETDHSRIGDGVNFNTVCGSCQGLGCQCILSGINIPSTAAGVGIGNDFSHFCGPNSVCIDTSNGQEKTVSCTVISSGEVPIKNYTSPPSFAALVVIFVLLFLTLILLCAAKLNSS